MNIKVKDELKNGKGIYFSNADIFESPSKYYRMRTECNLEIIDNLIVLNAFSLKTIERADKKIKTIINPLLEFINASEILKTKLFRIDFLANQLEDIVIALIYHKKLNDFWQIEASNFTNENQKINIIGISKKQKIIIGQDYVIEQINLLDNTLNYKYSYGLFSQPNTIINQKMLQWVITNTKEFKGDLLELYCGSGNFSLALAQNFKLILASELVKKAIKDAEFNAVLNNITNVKFVRMSSDEIEESFNKVREYNRLSSKTIEEYNFSTILVDPPRSGLTKKVINFMKRFDNIIYISCNPITLKRDIQEFHTHRIYKSALFDQFPGTEHIECGLILTKY